MTTRKHSSRKINTVTFIFSNRPSPTASLVSRPASKRNERTAIESIMMSPDSNDLSPRMGLSMEDIGESLSPFGNRNLDFNININNNNNNTAGVGVGSASSPTTGTMGAPSVLAIKEEDLWLFSDTLGQALDGADKTLEGLEADRELLPSAILRKCHEFADGLGSLAGELEGQSLQERKLLAGAIKDDLRLFDEEREKHLRRLSSLPAASSRNANTIVGNGNSAGEVKDEDIIQALSGASTLLRDVETAFREIGNDEAEEIADAALVMARLFILSLQNIHSNLVKQLTLSGNDPNDIQGKQSNNRSTAWIEELSNDDGDDNVINDNNDDDDASNNKENRPSGERRRTTRRYQQRRMRVLWPPLGPKVDTAMAWTREEATKRPFLAVALGLTLWPVAISTALVGTSVALIDGAFQDTYERFREGPWISVVEESAAQAYQASRLTVATGKLVGKQSLRVAARQIERRGGLQLVVQDLGGMALDKITHPIDTIGKIWDGVHWGFGVVKDATDGFVSMRRESQEDSLI